MITISRIFTSLALGVTATGLAVSLAITGKVIVMFEPGIGEALGFANPATVLSGLAGEAKPFFNLFGGSRQSTVAGTPAPADSTPEGTVRTAPQPGRSHRRHSRFEGSERAPVTGAPRHALREDGRRRERNGN